MKNQITVLRCVVARSDRVLAVDAPSAKAAQPKNGSLAAILAGAAAYRAPLHRCALLDGTGPVLPEAGHIK
jgi:hypothetical protein